MNELGRESRALIAASRGGDRMSVGDKTRIRGKIARHIGAGAALGSALTASTTAGAVAGGTAQGTWLLAALPGVAKALGIVAISTAVGVGTYHAGKPRTPSAQPVTPGIASAMVTAPRQISSGEYKATDTVVPAPVREVAPSSGTGTDGVVAIASAAKRRGMEPTAYSEPLRASGNEADALSGRVAAIRQVRAALRRGDAATALEILDRSTPSGAVDPLEQEAMLARLSALCLQGSVVAAAQIAQTFIARFPNSLLVQRVRASCAFGANEAP